MVKKLANIAVVLKESDLQAAVLRSFKKRKWQISQISRSTTEQVHVSKKKQLSRRRVPFLDDLE